ncbi:MAG: OsmC family protein, partial [Bauldia sp.]|nr:OsmC family protein [Bauldia sp.]
SAVAILQDGLRCRTQAPNGDVIATDMPKAVGGEGSAPSPGWLLRAALASCDATMIAMRAAMEGISLTSLEVAVDSDSDDRGLVGADDATPAGPLRVRVHVRATSDAPADSFRKVVDWAERHSPVGDAIRRSVPTSVTIESR